MKYLISLILLVIGSVANAQDEDYVSLQDRLKSNIFLKVDASNTDCFVGEPIVVTYKLYSALATESNIIRNPSFDGFDVKDLKGGSDHIASRETVDGVKFDVHTLLKLQLTPRRAGRLVLRALTVRNRVRLVDASGNEDPILRGVEEGYTLSNGYFTVPVSSVPITILVTALPGSSQPATTSPKGLVGDFKMDVQLSKKILTPGEQAELTIMLTGRGDFGRIEQPEIAWPRAADVLPAKIDEDKTPKDDGSGYKSFTIPFTINVPGKYSIPSIHFSFFDASSSRYKTITNIPIAFSVVSNGSISGSERNTTDQTSDPLLLWIVAAILLVAAIATVIVIRKRKRKLPPKPITPLQENKSQPAEVPATTLAAVLDTARENIGHNSSTFGSLLKQGMLQFLQSRWNLPAIPHSIGALQEVFNQKGISSGLQAELQQLMTSIDLNIYSGGGTREDRDALLNKANSLLHQL